MDISVAYCTERRNELQVAPDFTAAGILSLPFGAMQVVPKTNLPDIPHINFGSEFL